MPHPMRRDDHAITDPALIEELLRTARYARIALSDGTTPYVVTLSCGYDAAHHRPCFHVATVGRKLDIIAANPRACATIIHDPGYNATKCEHPFQSLVMEGCMRLLEDRAEQRAAMRALIRQLEGEEQVETIYERNQLGGETVYERMGVLVFEIEHLTAKQGK